MAKNNPAANPKNNQCSICGKWYNDSTSERRFKHFQSAYHITRRYGLGR